MIIMKYYMVLLGNFFVHLILTKSNNATMTHLPIQCMYSVCGFALP